MKVTYRLRILAGIAAIMSTAVYGQSYWRAQGANALVSMDMVGARKANVVATFLIAFNPRRNCAPEVGLSIAQGAKLGAAERQQWTKEQMVVTVDNSASWSERTTITKYSNGFEATFAAPHNLIERLKQGNQVHIRGLPGTPTFEFPLEGAALALKSAARKCRRG